MVFTIKQTASHGSSNPIVARMLIQSSRLIEWSNISQEKQKNVLGIFHGLQKRLLKCSDAYAELINELMVSIENLEKSNDPRVKYVPHIMNLEIKIETILYEWKNFLRDLLGVINIFFDTKFDSASAFSSYKKEQYGKLAKWALTQFGNLSPFTEMIVSDQDWIAEIVRKRNAIEHPGGHSGILHIQNIQILPDGKFLVPTWYCDSNQPTDILQDIDSTINNLLTLAEDILINCIMQKSQFDDGMITFAEIPEEERDDTCPIRITVVPGERMRLKLPNNQ